MNTEIKKLTNILGTFGNGIASRDLDTIKYNYKLLMNSDLAYVLQVSVHDIYMDALNNNWQSAKTNMLALLKECNARVNDGAGFISKHQFYNNQTQGE